MRKHTIDLRDGKVARLLAKKYISSGKYSFLLRKIAVNKELRIERIRDGYSTRMCNP
ncbi:MAG: hypothetical protein ACFFCI_20140 [Promethearchaeota archaeon]